MSTNWGMGRKGPTKMTDIRFGFVIPLWFLLWFSEAAITNKVSQRTHPYLTVKYLFYFFQIVLIYSVLNLLIRCLFFKIKIFFNCIALSYTLHLSLLSVLPLQIIQHYCSQFWLNLLSMLYGNLRMITAHCRRLFLCVSFWIHQHL